MNGSDRPKPESLSGQDERRRNEVMERVLDYIRRDETIRLPRKDRRTSAAVPRFALHTIEENDFSGSFGAFDYQFEGEDDLLHLIVVRKDGQPLTPQEGRKVVDFLMPGVSPAVIWLRPGEFSQHFYLGHDELLSD